MYAECDSMDQEKCALPHFARPPKDLDTSGQVKMHLTSFRVPALGCFEYLYPTNFAHDANATVTIVHR